MPSETTRSFELAHCECERHGAYSAYRPTDSSAPIAVDCPRCIDELEAARKAARRKRDDQQMRSRKLRDLHELSGIPALYADCTLSDYRVTSTGQRTALAICQGYAESWTEQYRKGGSLVFTGNVGTGKTHLACAIANAVIAEHMATVTFGTVARLIRSVRSTYGGKGRKTEQQALDDLQEVDLLIIDEVGVQNGSDHELAMLFEIINERRQNLRPTIMISNLSADDLKKFLGVRVMDRFRESGPVVAFEWESHRGKRDDA